MAIWAPLFASMHVELENVTIIFKDISPKREKEQTEDSGNDENETSFRIFHRLDCLRIANRTMTMQIVNLRKLRAHSTAKRHLLILWKRELNP